jgi:hypothetical protein
MRKEEFPPLLTAGFHMLTLAQLRELCVGPFSLSRTRASLMDNLERICDKLLEAGVIGELWVDGSFLTNKIDPSDIDIVLRAESAFFEGASKLTQEAMRWVDTNLKNEYSCDSHVFLDWPEAQHGAYELGEWFRRKYIRLFSLSRTDVVKGIALVSLRGTK